MSYNATVDVSSIYLNNNFKYDQNPLYEKSLRNIKYLPYDSKNKITNDLVDFFNAMIVRRDTEYYEKSRSKSNYRMENSDILNSVRNELKDYLKLYNDWSNKLEEIIREDKDPKYEEYKYMVNQYTIPEIIRLNKLIYLYISIPNKEPKINMMKEGLKYILIIGILIFIIILLINSKDYYN